MLGFPPSTQLHKPLPKAALYRKFNLPSSVQEKYDQDISRIYIENEISERTMNIAAGEKIKSFFVLSILIKNEKYDRKILERLSKLIPQKILMVIETESQVSLAVYEGGVLMQTEMAGMDSIKLPLTAIDLDQLWSNIVAYIGNFKISEGDNLQKTIELNEEIRKIKTRIETLKNRAFKETQTRRKWDLMAEAKTLENKLKQILL